MQDELVAKPTSFLCPRSLCQKVKSGCLSTMENHGFPWPSMLDCDKFPMDNDMCITSQSDKNGSGVGGQGAPKSISASNGAGGQTRKEQGKVIS